MHSLLAFIHWFAALVIIVEAFNKIERTEIFGVDEVLRARLAALRDSGDGGGRAWTANRAKCLWWRLVSMRDRAIDMIRSGTWRQRVVDCLKATGWVLLAIGAGGALVGPLLPANTSRGADVCIAIGFAILVIRSRVRERLVPCNSPHTSPSTS